MLNAEQLAGYRRDGFIVLRDVIDRGLAAQLYRATIAVARKYEPALPADLLDREPWTNTEASRRLIEMRTRTPELFGAVYDCMQTHVLVQQIAMTPTVSRIAADLLNEDETGLSATGHMLRMDPPEDKRNALDWHQESYYYNQNLAGENGVVIWYPLHDLQPEHGPVIVLPGSHREGRLCVSGTGKADYGTSEQFHVPADYVKRFEEFQVIIRCGDAVFFNFDLLHRSGRNISARIRFAAGVRYHRILTDDFLPGRTIYKPSEKVGRLSDRKSA